MSKRHVTYIKPEEPSFLRKLKEQAGYKEGPTVDTKRENLGPADEDDLQDTSDEQPTVVVLNPGDLTAEEAAKVQESQEREIAEARADLSLPIVFKAPNKKSEIVTNKGKRPSSSFPDSETSKKVKSKTLLSFDEDEYDDE